MPDMGVRVQTSATRTGAALDAVVRLAGQQGLELQRRDIAGGYVLATSTRQADALAGGGSLGSDARFRAAVPDAKDAVSAVFLDVHALVTTVGQSMSAQDRAAFDPVDAAGLTVRSTGSGSYGFRFELTTR
jgi:hypothetical protein